MIQERPLFSEDNLMSLPPIISLCLVNSSRMKNCVRCCQCNLVFRSNRDLNTHRSSGENPFVTILSNQSTKPEIDHTGLDIPEDLRCKLCDIKFKSLKGKKQHIGKVHKTKYKHSRCQICNKKFRNKYAVRFHVKQVHEKSTRVNCENCEKQFYNKYLLVDHLMKCKE